jgi:ABC-type multidrug transport system permease subunit
MKTIPLIQATLKGFTRNWRAIFLLVIFPLILISVVFLSFNPEGLQKIPIGIIGSSSEFNVKEYEDTYLSYLKIKEFATLNDCIKNLKIYNQYVCVNILYDGAIVLEVHYDNTQEPVIWEIIERIKATVDLLQKEKSKEMASAFLARFGKAKDKVDQFQVDLVNVHNQIDVYIDAIDDSADIASDAKENLNDAVVSMDEDIDDVKSIQSSMQNRQDSFHSSSIFYLGQIENSLSLLGIVDPTISSDISSLRNELNSYYGDADVSLNNADFKISQYKNAIKERKSYIDLIDAGIEKVYEVKRNLIYYKSRLEDAQDELSDIQRDMKTIEDLDPETLVSPIVIRNFPVYIPPVSAELLEKAKTEELIKGFNLISLQTIFPTVLLLISLFLSLLISNFICITDINSAANQRVRMIKGIFFPEMLSIYASSLIIMVLPIFCVLLLGNYLFRIEILANLFTVSVILFLLSSIFILLGMGLAYLIKKESITLLVTTFILVFLIFISGFLLPLERMSWFASYFATIFPTNIALSAFGKAVFYNQSFYLIGWDIISLLIWFIGFVVAVTIIKRIRRD